MNISLNFYFRLDYFKLYNFENLDEFINEISEDANLINSKYSFVGIQLFNDGINDFMLQNTNFAIKTNETSSFNIVKMYFSSFEENSEALSEEKSSNFDKNNFSAAKILKFSKIDNLYNLKPSPPINFSSGSFLKLYLIMEGLNSAPLGFLLGDEEYRFESYF